MRSAVAAGIAVSCSFMIPGTMFYDRAEELGLTILTRGWRLYDCKHMVMETKNFSAKRIEELAGGIASGLGCP